MAQAGSMQGGREKSLIHLDPPTANPTLAQSWLKSRLSPEVTFSHLCLSFCFFYNSRMNLLREDVFYLQFNNSHRFKPVQNRYYRRKSYLCYQLERANGQEPLKGYLLYKVRD